METVKRYLSGRHTPAEIRRHLAALALVYWGLVLCAWMGYPAEHHFSVTSHMLSSLGSFDDRHNPDWYWVFSVAMIYCGITMIPVMLYIRRRFAAVSRIGAAIGALFFLAGCVGMVLVGLFPYANGAVFGIWRLKSLHDGAAGTMGAAFVLGFLWHGLLLLKDRSADKTLAAAEGTSYLRFVGPYLVCAPIFVVAGTRVRWETVYAAIVSAVHASGREAADMMHTAFGRFHHFALLEHLAIWALTIYVIWFTIALPHQTGHTELSDAAKPDLQEDTQGA